MMLPLPQRVPENVPGDFYVMAGLCTQCCLVHGEAPDLLNDPKQPFKECYFRRQPQTPTEMDQAVSAIGVSEMCALRYAGNDQTIIRELRERSCGQQCDQTEEGRAWLKELDEARKKWHAKGSEHPVEFPSASTRVSWWRRLLGGGRKAREKGS